MIRRSKCKKALLAVFGRPEIKVFIPSSLSEADFQLVLRKKALLRWVGYEVSLDWLSA